MTEARAVAERIVGEILGRHVADARRNDFIVFASKAIAAALTSARRDTLEEAARVADGLSDAVQRAAYPQGKLAQVLPESNCYRRAASAVRALKVEEG